jgi:hypothetical protein
MSAVSEKMQDLEITAEGLWWELAQKLPRDKMPSFSSCHSWAAGRCLPSPQFAVAVAKILRMDLAVVCGAKR